MSLDLQTMIRPLALAALVLAGGGGCSDDGVPTQQSGTSGGADGNGSSGISTTMTAGTMTGPIDDGADDGTGVGSTASPPPDTGSDTADGPAGTTTAEDGTGSDTGRTDSGSTSSDSGSDSGSSSESGGNPLCDASPTPGVLPVGSECAGDSVCASGVCYDFADYDPFCGGTACSVCCEIDDDCVAAMVAAGAPNPEGTFCLADGRCDMVGTGLGGPYFCAGG